MKKKQKERFKWMQQHIPSLDGITEALSDLDACDTLESFNAKVAYALGVVQDLQGELQELEDEGEKLRAELEEEEEAEG